MAIEQTSPSFIVASPRRNQFSEPAASSVSNYNYGALAMQSNLGSPFLVSAETSSERSIASGDSAALAALSFEKAAERWLESRVPVLRGRTPVLYKLYISQLNKFFSDIRVDRIHVGHLMAYQKARLVNEVELAAGTKGTLWAKKAGPSCINHELSIVQQVMKRAKEWTRIGDLYTALPIPASKKQKVLDDIEKRRLFSIAATRPEWEIALLATKLTFNTTAAGCELRNLRFEDVILNEGQPRMIINGETAKNTYRGRTSPLNVTAQILIERCMERARKLGSVLPEHYIFPFRIAPGKFDPTRPATDSWLRRSFNSLRTEAGLPWLTPHCFRHMAITTLLEQGAAPESVRLIAGHVSEQMMRRYSHSRHTILAGVLAGLADAPPKPKARRTGAVRAKQRQFMARGRRRLPTRRPIA